MTFSERAVEAGLKAYNNAIDDLSGDTGGVPYSLDDIRRHGLTAALSAALAVDGLALVPKEPTDAVLRAGYEAWVDDKYDGSQAPLMCAVWTAMLTAASDGEVG